MIALVAIGGDNLVHRVGSGSTTLRSANYIPATKGRVWSPMASRCGQPSPQGWTDTYPEDALICERCFTPERRR